MITGLDSQDDDDKAEGQKDSQHVEISQVLSDIKLKKAQIQQARDEEFLQMWNDYFIKEDSVGYQVRLAGGACLPVTWLIMAIFKYKRF